MLSKQKENGDREFTALYFNSTAKAVFNLNKYGLSKSLQEILYKLDNWINKGSAWAIEYIKEEYINFSMYSPLSGSAYIELPGELKNSMKVLINIKNNDNKCFLWYHVRHSNLSKTHSERITKIDKKMSNDLDYKGVNFHISKKDYKKIEKKDNTCINVFCYESDLVYPVHISKQKLDDYVNLLTVIKISHLISI